MSEQNCPLCNNEADFIFIVIDSNDEKRFSCNTCTKFIITTAAEKRILAQTANWQEALSFEAQHATRSGFILRIYKTDSQMEPIKYECCAI